ncbi:MAG: Spectinomycin 3' adenylyltransferase [candidate division TM6 bacterium GW2011_GWF2_37_49]|nr:MAG: Spectinomycin 3' adenylyltransferase [candidate division TM6 bacterium GW2011_GWF2_37_49]
MFYADRIRLILSCIFIGMIVFNNCLTEETERIITMIKEPMFKSEEVSYQNNQAGITISGTLTLPTSTKPSATVILVPGYGPNDRDYVLFGHKRFMVLAEYLTQQGLAVLRFDKRGVGKSTGDYGSATSRDFADDVIAGIEYLKTRKDIDASKLGLIGHSEGGMISCMVAAESDDVAFVVMMAGVVQADVEDLVVQTAKQMKADGASDELITQDGKFRTQILTIVQQESDVELAKTKLQTLMQDYWTNLPEPLKQESEEIQFAITAAKIDGMTQVFNSPWYRYFLHCKPVEMLKQITVPVLALYGNRDWIASSQPSVSIVSETLKVLGNNNVTALELPNLNHSLQTCQTGALAEYATIEETIAPEVLKIISEWILNRSEKRSLANLEIDSNAKKQIHNCLNLVKEIFGQDLLGVYLYGSSILGGLQKYSDIDLFVVSSRATTREEKAKLTTSLLKFSGIYMKSQELPIEMTIVEKSELNPWHYPPRFDFQYGEWLRKQFEHVNIEPWPTKEMPDLALIVTQIFLASTTLAGASPDQLLCKVPYKDFMTAIKDALPNLMSELNSDTRNVLLTFARIWSTVTTDAIYSKLSAADLVSNRLPERYRPVMERAKAICKGEEKEYWDDIQKLIKPCADFMLSEITNKISEVMKSDDFDRSIKIIYKNKS